ncbi:MAG TPA: TonB-dependent receptor [Solimonas sp.]|nr:TonB-dependent receptor [Solimonas sp.]
MIRFLRARPLAALPLLLSSVVIAHEVSDPGTTVLPAVTVVGEKPSSLTAPSVREAHDLIEQTPGGVDLVSSEEFDDRYALNLKDMLRNTPGVYAQPRFAEEVRLSIRGSGLSRNNHLRGVLLLQDGVPLNLADGFGDFQEADPLSLRYVEVYKGGNGLRHGSSTLGGAINLVTPTGRTAGQQNLLRLEAGSFEARREHLAVARAGQRWDLYAAATGNQAEGFREQSASDNRRLNGNLGLQLGERAETRFYLNWNGIDQEIPGTVSLDAALNDPESVQASATSFDTHRNIGSLRLANKTSFRLAHGQVDVGGYWFRKQLYHPIANNVVDQDGDFHGAFAQWNGGYQLAGRSGELLLGSSARFGDNEALVFANSGGRRGAQTGDAREQAASYDLYGENRLWLQPTLALVTGLQLLRSERDFTDRRNPAESAQKDYKAANPKLGLLWQLQPEAQVYANVIRSYEPPIFSDLNQGSTVGACAGLGQGGFADLNAQRAWTAELGTRGTRQRWAWDLSVYRARVRDEMLQRACSPTAAVQFNADRTVHQGVEAGLAYRLADGLTLQQTYTFADFHFDGDPAFGSNQLAGQPRHYYLAELRYEHRWGFFVAPGIERAVGNVADYANTRPVPGYTLWNLGTGVDLPHGVSLFLEGRNLGDERYVSSVSATTSFATASNRNLFYPGEGRAVFGGLRWAF